MVATSVAHALGSKLTLPRTQFQSAQAQTDTLLSVEGPEVADGCIEDKGIGLIATPYPDQLTPKRPQQPKTKI